MELAEEHFLGTLSEMQEALAKDTLYTTMRASGVLRSLFLNGLMNTANRQHRLKIGFRVIEMPSFDLPEELVREFRLETHDGMAGLYDPNGQMPTKTLTRDQFLARDCMLVDRQRFTVCDVVRACANHEGGDHYDANPSPRGRLLRAYVKGMFVLDRQSHAHVIRDIMAVTLEALGPLEATIRGLPVESCVRPTYRHSDSVTVFGFSSGPIYKR